MAKSLALPRAKTAKSVGVNSSIVNDFLKEAEKRGLEYHSLMVVRNGKVAVEWYNEPYNKDTTHIVYSVSKSFTSTAIGFAISEGLLTLDTKVTDVFPEYAPKKDHEYFEKLTVDNLLKMSGGKSPSFLADKGKIDWIEDFINAPWSFEPGEKFLYINENFFMLSAMIKKLTGDCMREYLRPRLFEPLGIDYPFWETDRNGVEAGGWGLYLKTEDIAKFTLCYVQGGKYNGVQVIPEEWTKLATAKQIDNEYNRPGTEASVGYAYGFWKNKFSENSFRADGMFSQFGIGFPEHNAVVVVTSAIAEEMDALDLIFEHFPKAFDEKETEAVEIEPHAIEVLEESVHSEYESIINDRYIKFRKKILLNLVGFPMSMLPIAVVYMMTDKAGNIDMVKFNFQGAECTLQWTEGKETNTIPVGLDGHYRYGTMKLGGVEFKVCANAKWVDNNTLFLTVRPVQTVAKRTLSFAFNKNDRVTMTPSSYPSCGDILDSLGGFFDQVIPNKTLCSVVKKVVSLVPPLAEPKHYGKFVEKRK